MPVFSAAGAAIAGAIFGSGAASAIAIGATLGQFAGGLALNALASSLADPVEGPSAPAIRKAAERGVMPRSIILGRTATAGSYFFETTTGFGEGEDNRFYVVGHVLSDIPVRGLVEIWVNDLRCTVGGTYVEGRGYPIIPPPYYAETVDAWITFHDGHQTTADPVLLAAAEPGYEWNETDILRGCAYAVCVFQANPDAFPGFPQVLYVVDGAELDDAETGQAGTGDDLVAVQVANLLKGIRYGDELVYGPQVPGTLQNAVAEIAKCRAPVPGAETWTDQKKMAAFGSLTVPPQFRAGMEIPVNMPIADALSEIMATANGKIAFTGSGYVLSCGEPGAPVASIDAQDIILDREQSFSPFLPLAETVNSVIATYPEPKKKWSDREVRPLIVPAYEEEDGGRRLTTTIQLRALPYGEQVQRVRKLALDEARRAARVTFTLTPASSRLLPLDVISLTHPRSGSLNKLYRIDGRDLERGGRVTLDLTEIDDSWSWQEGDFDPSEPAPVTQQPVGTYDLLGFGAEPYTIEDDAGVPRLNGIRMFWSTDQAGRNMAYQVRTATTNKPVITDTAALQDGEMFTAEGLSPGVQYRVRGRKLMGRGKTPWTDWVYVTVGDVRLGPDDLQQNILDTLMAQSDYGQGVATQISDLEEAALAAALRISEIESLGGEGTEFASLMEQLEVGTNGVSAAISEFKRVATDVDGFAAAYAGVTAEVSGGSIAGWKATSFTNPDGTGGSLLDLLGDVVKAGTMSVDRLVSGTGANDLKNATFSQRTRYWRRTGTGGVFSQTEMLLKPPGTLFATPSGPTLRLRQAGSSRDGYVEARAVNEFFDGTWTNAAVPAEPGKYYMASAKVAATNCSGANEIFLLFRDGTGTTVRVVSRTIPAEVGSGANPEAWTRYATAATQAPAGTVSAQMYVRKSGTELGQSESNLYIHKPQLEETHAEATEPARWSAGGVSLIEGGTGFFEHSVGTYALNTAELSVAGFGIFGGEVRSINHIQSGGTEGWLLSQDGPAEFPNGIKTSDLQQNAATDGADIEDDGSINISAPAGSRVTVMLFAYYSLIVGDAQGSSINATVTVGNLGSFTRSDSEPSENAGGRSRVGSFAAARTFFINTDRPSLTITTSLSGAVAERDVDTIILVNKR